MCCARILGLKVDFFARLQKTREQMLEKNRAQKSGLTVATLGPGAVGGFVAGLLWRAGERSICVATEDESAVISENGIRIQSASLGDFVARPKTAAFLDERPDVLFIAVKAPFLRNALNRVEPELVSNSIIVPLLNGLEHMELLRERYGRRVAAATIGNVELKRISMCHVLHTTESARIELASNGDIDAVRLDSVARILNDAEIVAKVVQKESDVIWGKLTRLSALACATAASGRPIGEVRANPEWRRLLDGCLRESAAVAVAEGANIDLAAEMAKIDSLPASLGTSLQRDVATGQPSELDAIAGAVVRAASRHGIDCPTFKEAIALIEVLSRRNKNQE